MLSHDIVAYAPRRRTSRHFPMTQKQALVLKWRDHGLTLTEIAGLLFITRQGAMALWRRALRAANRNVN